MTKTESFIVTVDKNDKINVIDEIELKKYSSDKAQIDPQTGSKQMPQDSLLHGQSVLQPKYNAKHLIDLLDIYSYHADCVEAVATDTAGIDYTLDPIPDMESVESEKELFKEILENSKPSINVHLKRCIYDRRAIGYGALEVIRESTSESQIMRLKHIPSHTLSRHTDLKRVLQVTPDGKHIWFVIYGKNYDEDGNYADCDADTGEWCPYNSLPPEKKANEILWTMEYAPGTDYYGRPPIIATLNSIQGDISAVEYNTAFFKNNGMPQFAVTVTGDFVDYSEEKYIMNDKGEKILNPEYDETQTLRHKISEQIKQVIKNPHSAICITVPTESEEGNVEVKIIPLAVETKDGHFRMYRKDTRDEVIHAHQVDPSRLGVFDSGNLNGTNAKVTKQSYKYGTIAPIKSEAEAMINQIALDLGVTSWKFRINDVDPIDYSKDIELADFLFARGAMTILDLINVFGDKFGLNVENQDDPYLNSRYINNTPLEKLWNTTEANPYLEVDSILQDYENKLKGTDNDDKGSEETDTSSTNSE